MIPAQHVVASARKWLGTPYRHHGCAIQKECDCVGLVVGTGQTAGVKIEYAARDYSQHPKAEKILGECEKRLIVRECNPLHDLVPGEVVAMVIRGNIEPQHLGVIGDFEGRLTLIHAFNKRNAVVEHTLTDWWRKRIVRVFRYHGVDY